MGRALSSNVIRSKRAIKGRGPAYPQNIAREACRRLNAEGDVSPTRHVLLLFEQLFGRRAVRLYAIDMGLHSGDLGLQGFDAGVKFLDRDGIEILFCKLRQRVAGLAREEILEVHQPNR